MSKLILYAAVPADFDLGATQDFACAFDDELRFSNRLGESILIANIAPDMAQGCVAIGRLLRFESGADQTTLVRIEKIRPLINVVPLPDIPQSERRMSELADSVFSEIVAAAVGEGYEEDQFNHQSLSADAFAQQLRRAHDHRCGFSDVATEQGTAFMIQPPKDGGRWHTSNFLFLDPEPGKLFADFAWTVGPRFEIIMDAYAVGPNISDTVNRTGMLALRDMVASWPDRDALTWHRRQFFDRLR